MNSVTRDYWEARGGWDEEFIEHGPPERCLYCGADDCEGHSEAPPDDWDPRGVFSPCGGCRACVSGCPGSCTWEPDEVES